MLTQLLTVKSRLALDEFNVQYDSLLTNAIKAVSAPLRLCVKLTPKFLAQNIPTCFHKPMRTGNLTKVTPPHPPAPPRARRAQPPGLATSVAPHLLFPPHSLLPGHVRPDIGSSNIRSNQPVNQWLVGTTSTPIKHITAITNHERTNRHCHRVHGGGIHLHGMPPHVQDSRTARQAALSPIHASRYTRNQKGVPFGRL